MPQNSASEAPPTIGVLSVLAALFRLLTPRRRRQLYLCLCLMFVGALAELVTIGAVLPFLALIADPAGLAGMPLMQAAFERLGWNSGGASVLSATFLLCAAAAAAATIRLLLTWTSQSFVFGFGHELGVRIYSGLLHQPYLYHTQRNSSRGLAAVEKVQYSIINVLLPVIQGVVAAVMALFIAAFLIALQPLLASISAMAIGLLYAGISLATRGKLHRSSHTTNDAMTARTRQVQEGLGGIRDILLDRSHAIFERAFAEVDGRLRRSQLIATYIATVPRMVIEAAAIILIAALTVYMSRQPGGLPAAIPILGAFALGAQRLLPLLQIVYLGVSRTAGAAHAIDELVRLAAAACTPGEDLPPLGPPLVLGNAIEMRGLTFRYPNAVRPAVAGLDLRIAAGERVGLIGETGSGKSTLLDLVMGLLPPTEGKILVDGAPLDEPMRHRWQAQIAHVPQFIYLADTSIAANIAFGVPSESRNMARIRDAAARAQIAGFIESLPEGYDATVGERGIRLSGGQRQRLGIARALYKEASILVLDEATSALDDMTESAVMAALSHPASGRTMLIVAHRLTTLRSCDRLIRMENGRIVEAGSYADLVGELGARRA